MIMIFAWIDKHARVLLCITLALVLLLAGILVWDRLHPPVPVSLESRQEATAPAGAEKAAGAAQVPLLPAQAAAVAKAIKEDGDNPPDDAVQTTGAKLKDTIKTELQKSGGQFAVVTEPKKDWTGVPASASITGKAINAVANVGRALPNTPVTLNQYNIKAYPDRLIQVGGSYQEVFAAYSWKVDVPKIPLIAPHGDIGYLGVYGHANFDLPATSRIGIMLTIPR